MSLGKLSILLALFLAFSCNNVKDEDKQTNLLLRKIGHHLLLSSGDSTSRILPVQKTAVNRYQITFENQLEIMPDSLASIVVQNLKKEKSEGLYRVSVSTCYSSDIVYGFEWDLKSNDSIPCLGRKLPNNCYVVEIEKIVPTPNRSLLYGFFIVIILAGLAHQIYQRRLKKSTLVDNDTDEYQKLGAFNYFQKTGVLTLEFQKIELTEKENKLLNILLFQANETVSRDFLLSEIWEKEGVYVISRNLDVLVSKLRKKLLADSTIKITNSHGKGYKLEMLQ